MQRVKRMYWLPLIAIALGCAQGDRSESRDETSTPVMSASACAGGAGELDGQHVGSLQLGMSADSAIALCASARDTIAYEEGDPTRVLLATMGGDTLRIRITENSVNSIMVESPLFATADSLKVGVPLSRLLSIPNLQGDFGEGDFFVWSDDAPWCGLSFRLDDATARALSGTESDVRVMLQPYAGSGRVSAILVRGCAH